MTTDQTLHQAAASGNLPRVKELVESDHAIINADDEHGWRPIFHAAAHRRKSVLDYLIDRGADLMAHDGVVLYHASRIPDNKEVVRTLMLHGVLERYVQPVSDEARQLFAALFLGNAFRVESMLEANPALVAIQDHRGYSALHHAAQHGDQDVVRVLIRQGADVNSCTEQGLSALHCAVLHVHFPAVELLLEKGVDITLKTSDGATALDWARQHSANDPALRSIVWALEDFENDSREKTPIET